MPDLKTPPPQVVRQERYRQAALLLQKWILADPRYDESTGSALEQELQDGGMMCEERDDTSA